MTLWDEVTVGWGVLQSWMLEAVREEGPKKSSVLYPGHSCPKYGLRQTAYSCSLYQTWPEEHS